MGYSLKGTDRVAIQSLPRGADDDIIIEATKRVAEAATDFSWLSHGDTVVHKVAANSPKKYPSTTSPLAVRAMVALLKERGAGRVIVADKPGVEWVIQLKDKKKSSSRKVMTKNGLHAAAVESGAEPHYFDEAGFDAYFAVRPEHANHWKGELILPNILNETDHIIMLPRVSRHCLAGSTLGLKVAVGWLRDDSRLELHRDAWTFYDKIAEINDAAILNQKLRLTLSVGTKVLTTFGPDWGYKAEPDPGLIFASDSLIAHDMISLSWMHWNREKFTPESYKAPIFDWYGLCPGLVNRWLVNHVWGPGELLKSETYSAVDISTPFKDPIIRRAAAIWGGMPDLEIEEVGGSMPEDLRNYLKSQIYQ